MAGQAGSQTDAVAHWWFYAYGVAGVAAAVTYGFVIGWTLAVGLEVLILLALAGTLAYSGVDARERSLSAPGLVRAAGLTALTGASFSLLAVAVALVWHLEGHPVVDIEFMVVFAMWLGLAVGAQASLYAVASDEKRDRLADLVKLLTMNQRVLRHNLRNELSVVDGHLQNLEAKVGADDEDVAVARRHLDELLATSERARRILDIWESDSTREQDVGDALRGAVRRLRDEYPDVEVSVDAADGAVVSAHPALGDAFYELLANAIEHNGVDVRVAASAAEADHSVVVEIADTGEGIPVHERRILDQPGETTLSHASGLGLWFVYWTVRESGGTVSFSEREPSGTTARMTLPTATEPNGLWNRLVAGLGSLARLSRGTGAALRRSR